MPLRLNPIESLLARLSLLPVPLFDTPLGPGIAKAVVTACEMGLFDALSRRALPLNVLAGRLNCEPEGLKLLLNLLVSAGYLRERDGYYRNTRAAQRWLTSTSPFTVAPYVLHSPDIVQIWEHMPEVVRTNRMAMRMPYDEKNETPEEQARLARHYAGLASLANMLGREIVLRVHVPRDARALLDVGGSHAAYSALFCQRYRRLHATIIDMQAGLAAGERTAKMMHMEQRMRFIEADIVKDDFTTLLGEKFDVALYFHIAHLLRPEVNRILLARVAHALKAGGVLVFVDQVTDQTGGSRLTALMVQFMALTMVTVGGTTYPFGTVKEWLEQAGLEQVRSHRLLTPGAVLITAAKPKKQKSDVSSSPLSS
jgi:SAM-dependent methyltransferase